MEKTVKIFFACAAGADIGSVVALQFIAQLWWLGMLAGGLAGYILYDPKAIALAINTVWKQDAPPESINDSTALFWLGAFSCLTTAAVAFGASYWYWFQDSLSSGGKGVFLVFLFFTWFLVGAISYATTEEMTLDSIPKENRPRGSEWNIIWWLVFKRMFFLSFYLYWVPRGIILFFWHLPGITWTIMKAFCLFARTVFIAIHSSERLLCMVDAAIGVAVFHFTGNNIFLGMLAGGILGVINYEIVSVRLLKLTPR